MILSAGLVSDQLEEEVEGGEVEVEVVAVEAVVEVGDSLKVVEDGEALPKEVEEGILREEGVSLSRLKGEVVEEVGDVVVEALAVVALLVEEVEGGCFFYFTILNNCRT